MWGQRFREDLHSKSYEEKYISDTATLYALQAYFAPFSLGTKRTISYEEEESRLLEDYAMG
jgi:hypothetical protein